LYRKSEASTVYRVTLAQRRQWICDQIDAKGKAIAAGQGAWEDDILKEIADAAPFELTQQEAGYIAEYAEWRKSRPL